jgi:A/G-specific adenine glycosylase
MLPTLRSAIRRKLARWYQTNKRDLPWRRSHDPYAIWISETMLQQTQVNTVIPYYKNFLDRFPTVDALARAPLPQVLRFWSGLGYYRRAANLKQAAQQIVRRHGGEMPQDFTELRVLAGIGDYTAGALLSIAFGKPYPAIDGNVRRVLSRLLRITDERELRAMAAELVPAKRPGEFNQALMELGATICTPKNQRCSHCPMNSLCAGRSSPDAAVLGARTPVKFKTVVWPMAIVHRGGKILLRRRPANGLLAGLWELPGQELTGRGSIAGLFKRELNGVALSGARSKKLGDIRHAITYRLIRAPVYIFEFMAKSRINLPPSQWRWVAPAKLRAHAVSSMTAKAVALFATDEKNLR